MDINSVIPTEVAEIMDRLNLNGYDAFIVGGCVRDSFLMKHPSDWDITTSAPPEAVKHVFDKTIDTGIKHGTVSVLSGKNFYEVTTYRLDGCYSDNRRPDNVTFTQNLVEDLARRDFTINAMAYHPTHGLFDPFDGQSDLNRKLIRAVGDPHKRFNEDALRMLRAIRFSSQLNYEIEDNTFQSIKYNSELINKVSNERIRDELTKILISDNPQKFHLLKYSLLMKSILPEFNLCYNLEQVNQYNTQSIATHSLLAAHYIEKDVVLRWTMLLHDIGKAANQTSDTEDTNYNITHSLQSVSMAESILKRLKFDNKSIHKIIRLIKYHDYNIQAYEQSVRLAINLIGEDIFEELLMVKVANIKAKNEIFQDTKLDDPNQLLHIFHLIKQKGHCTSIRNLAINGNNLINLGFKKGKVLGNALNYLLEAVLDNPELNTEEKLIGLSLEYLKKAGK